MMSCRRRGFVLLAVLWVVMAMAGLTLMASLASRTLVRGSTRRVELLDGFWRAEDCLARARLVIDAALAGEQRSFGSSNTTWRSLPVRLRDAPLLSGCLDEISVVGVGSVVDVNSASADQLRRLFAASTSMSQYGVDSLVHAILDWRDSDDVPRAFGAEHMWYAARRRFPPRNGPFADLRELLRVRGLEDVAAVHTILGVESGRLSLAVASLRALASLPGMTPDALSQLEELRTIGELPGSLAGFAALLSTHARDSLHAHFAELSRLATMDPEGWLLTARGRRAEGAAPATIELLLVRAGSHATVLRRREWQ